MIKQFSPHNIEDITLAKPNVVIIVIGIKSNLLLYSLYYAEACNELAGSISAQLRLPETQLFSKKCRSGRKPLATLSSIRPA